MLKPFSKLALFGLLSTMLVLSAGALPIEEELCGPPGICIDKGCLAAGGVCAWFTPNGACFCAYPSQ